MSDTAAPARRPSPRPRPELPSAPAQAGPPWRTARVALARQRLQYEPVMLRDRDSRRITAAVVAMLALLVGATVTVLTVSIRTIGADAGPGPLTAQYLSRPVVAGVNASAAPNHRARAATQQPVRMGGWTPEIGRQIAERALRWLDWPYSFAGGNAHGPTYGVAVDEASRNDPHIRGFDCSGLVLYALAPWRQLTHLASAQYVQTGTWHPALNTLLPGDLVFWSRSGTIADVGHVAIYVGDGKVVQAPNSGARIVITPIDEVRAGKIGTVRPLT